jgi:hypothetical protein
MSGTSRAVAVTVGMEDRLQPLLQQHGRCGLGHPISRIRHPEGPHPLPMILGYLHRPHRPRHVTTRGHPVPQLVKVVGLFTGETGDADSVHTGRTLVGPDLLPRLEHETLRNVKRLHLQSWSLRRLLPHRGWPLVDLARPAPWLRPHYRAIPATTGWSAHVPRIGTLPLAVSAAWSPPSRSQGAKTHFDWPSLSGRQVLLFHASACDELTPLLHRAPPRPHAGRSSTESTPRKVRLCPGVTVRPRFWRQLFAFRCVSSGSHMFVFSSLTCPDPCRDSSATLTTPALNRRRLRWFGLPACTASPEGQPPSLAQHAS